LSSKKRFQQIETTKPSESKKTSILDKFSFKRKLEIEGVEREKIPVEKAPRSSNQTPEVKITRVYQPNTGKPSASSAPVKADLKESKVELDNLAREIELAEQKKHAREVQQKAVQVQKNVEQNKKAQLEEAQQRAESAKNKILLAIIVIPILGYIVIQLAKTAGTGQRGGIGSELFWLIITIALGGYGRRRWNRW